MILLFSKNPEHLNNRLTTDQSLNEPLASIIALSVLVGGGGGGGKRWRCWVWSTGRIAGSSLQLRGAS